MKKEVAQMTSKSTSNPNIQINAGNSTQTSEPIMIASGNVYLRLGFLFMLCLLGMVIWLHVKTTQTLNEQTKTLVSIAYTLGQHSNEISSLKGQTDEISRGTAKD